MSVITNIQTKKKKSETGAKYVISAASGPGLIRCGMTIPIAYPEMRFAEVHLSSYPSAVSVRGEVGEIVPSGKSMSRKCVRIVRSKFLTRFTLSPNEYFHVSRPREV